MSQGFHHVALACQSFERSVEFYSKKLGFAPAYAWGEAPKRAVLLDVGNGGFLELFERTDAQTCACGPNCACSPFLHIALNCADVDAAIAIVKREGLEVTVEPKDVLLAGGKAKGGLDVRLAFFKGPDGEVVEFFHTKE